MTTSVEGIPSFIRIFGLRSKTYDIVKNVLIPARISWETEDWRLWSEKILSSMEMETIFFSRFYWINHSLTHLATKSHNHSVTQSLTLNHPLTLGLFFEGQNFDSKKVGSTGTFTPTGCFDHSNIIRSFQLSVIYTRSVRVFNPARHSTWSWYDQDWLSRIFKLDPWTTYCCNLPGYESLLHYSWNDLVPCWCCSHSLGLFYLRRLY